MFKLIKSWKSYKTKLKEKNKTLGTTVTVIEDLVIALIAALIIKSFILESSMVYSGSMIPTMKVRDFLFVNKFIYKFREPKRSEIVLFRSPYAPKPTLLQKSLSNIPGYGPKNFVKRLVGLPNEKVEIKKGVVYINDKQLVFPGINVQRDNTYFGPIIVPENHYFFLGDNRSNSADSRYWGFVPKEDLVGKAIFTFWPLSHMQVLH